MTALDALVEQAAALVEQIGDQAERDNVSYAAGYRAALDLGRLMFEQGIQVGRAQVRDEDRHAWGAAVEPAQDANRAHGWRTRAELDALRYPGYTPERLTELRTEARRRYGLLLEEER